jgi:hypothetical protein
MARWIALAFRRDNGLLASVLACPCCWKHGVGRTVLETRVGLLRDGYRLASLHDSLESRSAFATLLSEEQSRKRWNKLFQGRPLPLVSEIAQERALVNPS